MCMLSTKESLTYLKEFSPLSRQLLRQSMQSSLKLNPMKTRWLSQQNISAWETLYCSIWKGKHHGRFTFPFRYRESFKHHSEWKEKAAWNVWFRNVSLIFQIGENKQSIVFCKVYHRDLWEKMSWKSSQLAFKTSSLEKHIAQVFHCFLLCEMFRSRISVRERRRLFSRWHSQHREHCRKL